MDVNGYFVRLTSKQMAKVVAGGSAKALKCNKTEPSVAEAPAAAVEAQASVHSTASIISASSIGRPKTPKTPEPEAKPKRRETLYEDRAFKKPPEPEIDYFSPLETPEPWQFKVLLQPKTKDRPPNSFEEAKEWYEKIVWSKDPNDGYAGLGQMLAYGWGVPRDRPRAFHYFTLASSTHSHGRGCAGMGQCFLYGWGVEQDYTQALKWLRLGAGGYYGDALAQFEIGRMSYYRRGHDLIYDDAFKWQTWSAQQGFAPANYCLGMMYWYGTAPAAELVTNVVSELRAPVTQTPAARRARPRAAREREEAVRKAMSEFLITDRRGLQVERVLQHLAAASAQGHSCAAVALLRFKEKMGGLFPRAYPVRDDDMIQLRNPALGKPGIASLYPTVVSMPVPRPVAPSTTSTELLAGEDRDSVLVAPAAGGLLVDDAPPPGIPTEPIGIAAVSRSPSPAFLDKSVSFSLPPIGRPSTSAPADQQPLTPNTAPPASLPAHSSPHSDGNVPVEVAANKPWTPKQRHTLQQLPTVTAPEVVTKLRKKITITFDDG